MGSRARGASRGRTMGRRGLGWQGKNGGLEKRAASAGRRAWRKGESRERGASLPLFLAPCSALASLRSSPAGGEGDDLDAGAVVDGCRGEVAGKDGFEVEFDDDGFAGEAEGGEEIGEGGGAGKRVPTSTRSAMILGTETRAT